MAFQIYRWSPPQPTRCDQTSTSCRLTTTSRARHPTRRPVAACEKDTAVLPSAPSGWPAMYNVLVEHCRKNGNGFVSQSNGALFDWCQEQRRAWHTLEQTQRQQLLAIGFINDTKRYTWNYLFHQLSMWHRAHGHFDIPASFVDLGLWANEQRVLFESNRLGPSEKEALAKLGFLEACENVADWFANAKYLHEVCQGIEQSPVQCATVGAVNLNIMIWAMRVAPEVLQKDLDIVKQQALAGVDLDWQSIGLSRRWGERYIELYDFHCESGHCKVCKISDPALVSWTSRQRVNYRAGKLSDARTAMLNLLGFRWDTRDQIWSAMLAELLEYREIHGHCNVPQGDDRDVSKRLANWTMTQRIRYNKGELMQSRIDQLNAAGFVWKYNTHSWDERLHQFAEFKRDGEKATRELSAWINFQRLMQRRGKMSEDRVDRLSELGFVWDPWEEKYRDLLRFERQFGHTMVPKSYRHGVLYNFLRNQRTKYRKGTLSSEKVRLLNSINVLYVDFR